MKAEDQYHRFVRWSDEDSVYIGYCPDLYLGAVCHSETEETCYADLCQTVRDEIAHRLKALATLPQPTIRVTRDLDLVSA